jgi:hypothetical protein
MGPDDFQGGYVAACRRFEGGTLGPTSFLTDLDDVFEGLRSGLYRVDCGGEGLCLYHSLARALPSPNINPNINFNTVREGIAKTLRSCHDDMFYAYPAGGAVLMEDFVPSIKNWFEEEAGQGFSLSIPPSSIAALARLTPWGSEHTRLVCGLLADCVEGKVCYRQGSRYFAVHQTIFHWGTSLDVMLACVAFKTPIIIVTATERGACGINHKPLGFSGWEDSNGLGVAIAYGKLRCGSLHYQALALGPCGGDIGGDTDDVDNGVGSGSGTSSASDDMFREAEENPRNPRKRKRKVPDATVREARTVSFEAPTMKAAVDVRLAVAASGRKNKVTYAPTPGATGFKVRLAPPSPPCWFFFGACCGPCPPHPPLNRIEMTEMNRTLNRAESHDSSFNSTFNLSNW